MKAKKQSERAKINWNCCSGGNGFALFLIVIGGYFLARDLGWLSTNVSFWPVILIAFGVFIMYNNYRKTC